VLSGDAGVFFEKRGDVELHAALRQLQRSRGPKASQTKGRKNEADLSAESLVH